jgi:hypothetical protein
LFKLFPLKLVSIEDILDSPPAFSPKKDFQQIVEQKKEAVPGEVVLVR